MRGDFEGKVFDVEGACCVHIDARFEGGRAELFQLLEAGEQLRESPGIVSMPGVTPSIVKSLRGEFRRADAMHMDQLRGQAGDPSGGCSGRLRHAGHAPKGDQNSTGGMDGFDLKEGIAFAAQLAAPSGIARTLGLEESLQNIVLIYHGEGQKGCDPAGERTFAATGQTGNYDKSMGRCGHAAFECIVPGKYYSGPGKVKAGAIWVIG